MRDTRNGEQVEQLLETTGLADALESDRFKQFLDHVPVAIAVSELHSSEAITYANLSSELRGRPPYRCKARAGSRFRWGQITLGRDEFVVSQAVASAASLRSGTLGRSANELVWAVPGQVRGSG